MSSRTGSAPGRLDLLGGVADYSGARVLEVALAALRSAALHGAEQNIGTERHAA